MVDRNATLEELLRTRHAELPLYLITLTPNPAKAGAAGSDEAKEMQRQHFLYWWELEEKGVLVGAGPTEFGTPQQAGLAIVIASSREEAERLAAEEPFHKAGWRTNTVRSWQLNEGLAVPLVQDLVGR